MEKKTKFSIWYVIIGIWIVFLLQNTIFSSLFRIEELPYSEFINALKKGERVAIAGFGTFSVGSRAARQGRNPQTGATIQIPASKTPRFKAGKALREAVQ